MERAVAESPGLKSSAEEAGRKQEERSARKRGGGGGGEGNERIEKDLRQRGLKARTDTLFN